MNFVWTTLRVNNFAESIKFYTDIIGLKVVNQFESGGTSIAFLEDGNSGTQIELLHDNSDRKTNAGEDISWGFSVDSLEETMDLLNQRNIEYVGPIQPNPNTKFIFIKDPNGMKVQLVEI